MSEHVKSDGELVTAGEGGLQPIAPPMSVDMVVGQVKLVHKIMKDVMQDKTHYGVVPGCGDKKVLLQPGAQKLCLTFRLATNFDIQTRELGDGHREYQVICTLTSIGSGAFVGQGVGICSTHESKYRWRKGERECPGCGKPNIRRSKPQNGGGWYCWVNTGGCGANFEYNTPDILDQNVDRVENPDPADYYNTCLKMAKKRAHVDATVTALAASDIFTQDIGDDGDTPEPAPQQQAQQQGRGQQQNKQQTQQQRSNGVNAAQEPRPPSTVEMDHFRLKMQESANQGTVALSQTWTQLGTWQSYFEEFKNRLKPRAQEVDAERERQRATPEQEPPVLADFDSRTEAVEEEIPF
jgi:hypothetical protein